MPKSEISATIIIAKQIAPNHYEYAIIIFKDVELMNYNEWSKEYIKSAEKIKNCIEKEKVLLKKAKTPDDIYAVNTRLSILRSMFREAVATSNLLAERSKMYPTPEQLVFEKTADVNYNDNVFMLKGKGDCVA